VKWPQIVAVLLGVVAVAIAVRRHPEKPAPAPQVVTPPAPATPTNRILSPSTEQPGVVSRLIGLTRTYVALPEEVRLEPVDATAQRVVSVPIHIVIENESYRPLPAADAGWLGNSLCTVRVMRVPERGSEVEVFQREVPLPSRADWLSAERRSFSVDWPMQNGTENVSAGLYRVTIRLALPDEPAVEIYTRVL
jgi:hypothetical protein